MSSTVTTATVSTVTAAITIEGLGQIFTLIAILLLGLVILAKEISSVSSSRGARALARGLDVGIAPLAVVFLVMLALNSTSYFTQ
jgi:hypothetical protein